MKEMICLANSRKHGGRCIAGLTVHEGEWIRPVSREPDGVLYPRHIRLANGSQPQVLDLLRAPCLKPVPKKYHPEDWELQEMSWSLKARPVGSELLEIVRSNIQYDGPLLGDTEDRLSCTLLDRKPISSSLALIAPKDILWLVQPKEGGGIKRKVSFRLGKVRYMLSLTDPSWETRLQNLSPGSYSYGMEGLSAGEGEPVFTISLSEPFQPEPTRPGCCYKLVAAVFTLPK